MKTKKTIKNQNLQITYIVEINIKEVDRMQFASIPR